VLTCFRYTLRMEQSELIERRLAAIEIKVYELCRGVAAVRYGIPGIFRIAIGVALGLALYSAICILTAVLFWGAVIAGMAGAGAGLAGGLKGANQPSSLPQQGNR
jgi:hypothetical protein